MASYLSGILHSGARRLTSLPSSAGLDRRMPAPLPLLATMPGADALGPKEVGSDWITPSEVSEAPGLSATDDRGRQQPNDWTEKTEGHGQAGVVSTPPTPAILPPP